MVQHWNKHSLRLPLINPQVRSAHALLVSLNVTCWLYFHFFRNDSFFFFLLDYQQSLCDVAKANFCSSAWIYPECYWSSCTNTPQAGTVQCTQPITQLKVFFFFLYFAYTACVLRVSTVSVIMQYGLGRGAGVGRRVTWGYPLIYCTGHHLLAPLCSPCKNVLPCWVQTDGQPASIIHCYSFMLSHLCVIAFHYSSEPPSPLPDRFE